MLLTADVGHQQFSDAVDTEPLGVAGATDKPSSSSNITESSSPDITGATAATGGSSKSSLAVGKVTGLTCHCHVSLSFSQSDHSFPLNVEL